MLKNIFNANKDKARLVNEDPFLKRLRCSIMGEGMLSDHNILLMERAVKQMPDTGVVLEIGSFAGLSANVILHLLNKHNRSHELLCVDAWIYEGYNDHTPPVPAHIDGRIDVKRQDYTNYIRSGFINSIKLFQPNRLPYAFHSTSNDFFSGWGKKEMTDLFGRSIIQSGSISFCYIDGDHSYQAAKDDFENAYRLLAKGGFILMDDTADKLNFGSCKVARELAKDDRIELIDAENNYLFRKK
jgi:predicted O-methyltransferase YrrM